MSFRHRALQPHVVLGAGIAALALFLMLGTAVRIPVLVSFDETVYKLAASHYATGGLDAVLHDGGISRGIARLYSLVLAPVFWLFDGTTGVRVARGLGSVTFALAAIPVYLLARQVVGSPWRAVAAALLAIAIPWATVSTVLFSEVLAYPLFCTALLAMVWALRAPSWRRELVVFGVVGALILVRPQSAGLVAAWIVLIALLRRSQWRRFPLTVAFVGGAALVILLATVAGRLPDLWDRTTGPYFGPGVGWEPSFFKTALFEVTMIGLGTGLIPLILAVGWAWPALRGRRTEDERRVAAVMLAGVVAVWVLALFALGMWPGPDVAEERYFIYAVPAILVGAFAARPTTRALLVGGAVMLVLLALTPITAGLSSERAFLVPIGATLTNLAQRLEPENAANLWALTGTRRLIALAIGAAVLALALALVRRRPALVLVPAVILQLAFGGYALATMHGKVPGVAGVTAQPPTFADQAFVDRTTTGDPDVAMLADSTPSLMLRYLNHALFNDELNRTVRFEDIVPAAPPYPVSALPVKEGDLVLATKDSPFVQLGGEVVFARDHEVLLEPDGTRRWEARGLSADGTLTGRVQVTAPPARVTLTFAGDGTARFGSRTIKPGTTTVDGCKRMPRTITPRRGTMVLGAVTLRPC